MACNSIVGTICNVAFIIWQTLAKLFSMENRFQKKDACRHHAIHRGIFYSVHSHVEFFYFVFHSKHIGFF